VFALNDVFMQAFHRTGLAPRRDGIGAGIRPLVQPILHQRHAGRFSAAT
jgi:hypothetical protein